RIPAVRAAIALLLLLGCGGPSTLQLPPANAADLEVWLTAAYYRSWRCEPAVHAPPPPSPHSLDRICQNDLASSHGAGEYPVGSASVRELYTDSGGLRGYSVNRHVSPGAGGATWYWYEAVDGRVTADGTGDSGVPKTVCTACHSLAGTGS